jgi:drug/metabolite transporter (DMT)-like permease
MKVPSSLDLLLLLMTLIWGTNYSIVKHAFDVMDPQAFNAARMLIGSIVFLAIIYGLQWKWPSNPDERERNGAGRRGPASAASGLENATSIASIFHTRAAITGRDWLGLAGLGVVGHFFYQYFFISGLALTSVANSSLILAATPVVIALFTAVLGQERVSALHWLGAALSMAGIYLVVAKGGSGAGGSLRGDLMMFAAVCCWTTYTIGARALMVRHSPVGVTGISMTIGTVLYVTAMLPHLARIDWSAVSAAAWIAVVYSALFALCVSYTIWYAAVRAIGSARTAVYSNLVPLVAMMTAVAALGEPLSVAKLAGAAAVLLGVALTRVGRARLAIPAEE